MTKSQHAAPPWAGLADLPNLIAPARAAVRESDTRSMAIADAVDPDARRMAQWLINTLDDHAHLRAARIALLFRTGAKPNADGQVQAGKAKKSGLLHRLGFEDADFLVTLNGDAWPGYAARQRPALLDHELSHCAVAIAGKYVDPANVAAFEATLGDDHVETHHDVIDDDGRVLVCYVKRRVAGGTPIWRIRKHDVEEFVAVARRWGEAADQGLGLVDLMEPPDDGQLLLGLE